MGSGLSSPYRIGLRRKHEERKSSHELEPPDAVDDLMFPRQPIMVMDKTSDSSHSGSNQSLTKSFNSVNLPPDRMSRHTSYQPTEYEAMVRGVNAHKKKNRVLFGERVELDQNFEKKVIPKPESDQIFILEALRDYFLFSMLSEYREELNDLMNAMERVECTTGQYIITQGDRGDYFYLLQDGHFDCFVNSTLMTSYKPGACFGELALLYDAPRAATIACTIPSVLWSLDRRTFRRTLMFNTQRALDDARYMMLQTSLLKDLTTEQVNRIAEVAQIVQFQEGDMIIKKGDAGNVFYMIKEGIVKCTEAGEKCGEVELHAGEHFGERALLLDEPRAANVIAVSRVVCLAVGREDFADVVGPLKNILETNTASYVIRSLPQLASLLPEEKQAIVNSIKINTYEKGAVVEEEGADMDKFIVVKSGKLAVTQLKEQKTRYLSPGSYINDNLFVRPVKNPYRILAAEPSVLLVVSQQSMIEVMRDRRESAKSQTRQSIYVRDTHLHGTELHEYGFLRLIGAGSFGVVSLVQLRGTAERYALKKVSKKKVVEQKQDRSLLNEKTVLSRCSHPFIQKLYWTMQDKNNLYFILEFFPGGELFNRIGMQGDILDSKEACFYAACILSAMGYLHDRSIVYRDLKPENVMINSKGYATLIDFGFAKETIGKCYTLCGTPEYLAPEVVVGKGHNKAVDYWSLGICIYEMLVGYSPFSSADGSTQSVFRKIMRGKYEFPSRLKDSLAKNLIFRLLTTNPSARLGCLLNGHIDIKRHEWFSDIDWMKLEANESPSPWIPDLSEGIETYFPKLEAEGLQTEIEYDGDQTWCASF